MHFIILYKNYHLRLVAGCKVYLVFTRSGGQRTLLLVCWLWEWALLFAHDVVWRSWRRLRCMIELRIFTYSQLTTPGICIYGILADVVVCGCPNGLVMMLMSKYAVIYWVLCEWACLSVMNNYQRITKHEYDISQHFYKNEEDIHSDWVGMGLNGANFFFC